MDSISSKSISATTYYPEQLRFAYGSEKVRAKPQLAFSCDAISSYDGGDVKDSGITASSQQPELKSAILRFC